MNVLFTHTETGRGLVKPEEEAIRAIVELCGGGWTEANTAKAMETLAAIRDGKVIRFPEQRLTNPRTFAQIHIPPLELRKLGPDDPRGDPKGEAPGILDDQGDDQGKTCENCGDLDCQKCGDWGEIDHSAAKEDRRGGAA